MAAKRVEGVDFGKTSFAESTAQGLRHALRTKKHPKGHLKIAACGYEILADAGTGSPKSA